MCRGRRDSGIRTIWSRATPLTMRVAYAYSQGSLGKSGARASPTRPCSFATSPTTWGIVKTEVSFPVAGSILRISPVSRSP